MDKGKYFTVYTSGGDIYVREQNDFNAKFHGAKEMTYKAGEIVVNRQGNVVQLTKVTKACNYFHPLGYHIGDGFYTVAAEGGFHYRINTLSKYDIVRRANNDEKAKFQGAKEMTYKSGDIVVTRAGGVVQLIAYDNRCYPLRYYIGDGFYTVTTEGAYYAASNATHEHDIIRHATAEERARFLSKTGILPVGAFALPQDEKDRYLVQVVGHAAELRHIHDTLDAAKTEAKRLARNNEGVNVRVLKVVAQCKLETKVTWV